MIVGTCERCWLPVEHTEACITEFGYRVWHSPCRIAEDDENAEQRAEREWEDAQAREDGGTRCPSRE